MKIKVTERSYSEVMAMTPEKHKKPKKPNLFFRTLLKLFSMPDLSKANFECNKIGMERLGKHEPCLFLMNHSSFIDLEIVGSVLYPRPFNIVATTDGFVGKSGLMRSIGCIPTKKFVFDIGLIRDTIYTVNTLKSSVVMYPEASYSFDGTATTLPDSLGKYLKLLGVPVVMIRTYGAFTRDPLYNGLQKRDVKVSADMKYLLSAEDINEKTPEELDEILKKEFDFDNFRWQQENKIKVDEPFRADMLNRVLYKCPLCLSEGKMLGKGTEITCSACGRKWELDEYGFLVPPDGEEKFRHIPDWYRWERECVAEDIAKDKYYLDVPVKILMAVDTKAVYDIGRGRLTHSSEGFHLRGADGELDYRQKPRSSYSLYSDFYWYEIGDVICIGNQKALYYCFPEDCPDTVAKARLATEELYKIFADAKRK